MTNQTYAKFRGAALQGLVNVLTDDIRLVLVDGADYTPNLTTHEFYTDVPVGAVVSVSEALTGKSVSGSTFISSKGATGINFDDVTGDTCELILVVKWTGVPATTRLIAKIDTATNLPINPPAGDINAFFADGKIFDL